MISFIRPSFILLVVLLINSNTLQNQFAYDDRMAILQNPSIQEFNNGFFNCLEAFSQDYWGKLISDEQSHKSYRPLTVLSFRLDAWLQGSITEPYLFHLSNIIYYSVCTLLVYYIGLALMIQNDNSRKRSLPKYENAALVGALLFAVHPVHCEAVASIVGRADILGGIFVLLGIYQFEIRKNVVTTIVCGILGLLCKETSISLFLYCAFRSAMKPKDFFWFSFTAVSFLSFRVWQNGEHVVYQWTVLENHIALETNIPRKMFSTMHAHALALELLTFSSKYCFDHGLGASPILDMPSLQTFVAYAIVCMLLYKSIRNRFLGKLAAIAIFGYLPSSNILISIGTVVAERLLFIPSIALSFFVGYLYLSNSRIEWKFACAVLLFFYAKCAYQRNTEWMNDQTIYESALRVYPKLAKANNNLGYLILENRSSTLVDYHRANDYVQNALEIYPSYHIALLNAVCIYLRIGKYREAAESSLHGFNNSTDIDLKCNFLNIHLNGLERDFVVNEVLPSRDQVVSSIQLALDATTTLCASSTVLIPILYHTAILQCGIGNFQIAYDGFERVLELNPLQPVTSSVEMHLVFSSYADCLRSASNNVEAIRVYDRASSRGIKSRELIVNSAVVWMHIGDQVSYTYSDGRVVDSLTKAEELLRNAIQLYPDCVVAMVNLAVVLYKKANYLQAKELYQHIYSIGNHPYMENAVHGIEDCDRKILETKHVQKE